MLSMFKSASFWSSTAFLLMASVSFGNAAQAQTFTTFSVDNGSDSRMALNTNNNFRKIDGQPRMSLWKINQQDLDQQFQQLTGRRGGVLLKHRSTGKCINAYRRFNGAEFNVWPCNPDDPDQNFNVNHLGNSYYHLKLVNTNFCIDSPTPRINGGKVHLWTCNTNNPNQRWKISTLFASPGGQINLPFRSGQTWYVCQGYQGTVTHQTTFGLDLTVSNKDFGGSACYASDGNVNKSAGQPVLAPASGRVFHVGPDLICLQLDNNRSMLIGHITRKVSHNTAVDKDTVLGTLSSAKSVNGGYAHIHIEGRRSSDCQPGTSVPLTASNGFQFAGVGDLPDLPGRNDYFKRALTRP